MSIRPKSSCTYLILILTCFFVPQVQAGWMDDLKNTTGAVNDAVTSADEAVNSADEVVNSADGAANSADGAVNEAVNKTVNDAATSANEAVNKAVQPAPSY
jgi:hypothetical protein